MRLSATFSEVPGPGRPGGGPRGRLAVANGESDEDGAATGRGRGRGAAAGGAVGSARGASAAAAGGATQREFLRVDQAHPDEVIDRGVHRIARQARAAGDLVERDRPDGERVEHPAQRPRARRRRTSCRRTGRCGSGGCRRGHGGTGFPRTAGPRAGARRRGHCGTGFPRTAGPRAEARRRGGRRTRQRRTGRCGGECFPRGRCRTGRRRTKTRRTGTPGRAGHQKSRPIWKTATASVQATTSCIATPKIVQRRPISRCWAARVATHGV